MTLFICLQLCPVNIKCLRRGFLEGKDINRQGAHGQSNFAVAGDESNGNPRMDDDVKPTACIPTGGSSCTKNNCRYISTAGRPSTYRCASMRISGSYTDTISSHKPHACTALLCADELGEAARRTNDTARPRSSFTQ